MAPPKRGLGRGLDALIPQSDSSVINPPSSGLIEIDPTAVAPNPEQPRHEFNEDELAQLANSISLYGLLHPIVVEQVGGAYRLVAGERRLRASQKIGLSSIPAIVRPTSARREALELALTENIFRSDLSPIEEAAAYSRLAETFGLSHETIATRLGKSRSTITNTIRLLNLPAPIQQAIRDHLLSAGHGRALLSLETEAEQLEVAELMIREGWSVRDSEQQVQKFLSGEKLSPVAPESKTAKGEAKETNTAALEDDTYCKALETVVGLKVALRRRRKGGLLILHFTDNEDLSTFYNRLGGPPL